ncbi:MAG TPA: YceI family protein, partial [Reyranella sp.]|nr:YceI family protein [Reyranella sp.]
MRIVLAVLALLLAVPALAGPADPWTIDPAKSRIAFSVEQVGRIAAGRIGSWTGTIVFDPADLANARIDIRMDLRTASTGARDVDDMMLGANFLDARRQPEARFTSTA